MSEHFELQRLLWDLRHDPDVVERMTSNRTATMSEYGLDDSERTAMQHGDFSTLLALGVNPLLLYFGALELGVSRDDYYAALRSPGAATRQRTD